MGMRRWWLIILICLLPSLAVAKTNPYVAGCYRSASAWSSGCPNAGLLLCESFDGASSCATSYTSNCDNTWTVAEGTPGFQGSQLDGGSYALSCPGKANGAQVRIYKDFTATAGQPQEIYLEFDVTDNGTTATYDYTLFYISAGTSARATVYLARVSGVFYLKVQASGGTKSAATVSTVSTNHKYHLWLHYLKGSGANAVASVAFSDNGVRPTSGDNYVESTDGTATTDASRIYLEGNYASANNCVDVLFDKVRVDDATIGDNPN